MTEITGKYPSREMLVDAVTTFADIGKPKLWIAARCQITREEVQSIIQRHRSGYPPPTEYVRKPKKEPKPRTLTEAHTQLRSNRSMLGLISAVERWHQDRNLIDGSTDSAQLIKLQEELDELKFNVENGNDVKDDIGDMLVVLINIAYRNRTNLTACLAHAYDEIKDRKGKMVDGIFVKEAG